MSSTNLEQTREQVASHLRFLGYEVTPQDKSLLACHRQKPNMIVQVYSDGILHTAIWSLSDNARTNRQGFLEYINALNEGARVVRYYAKQGLGLLCEGCYTGGYDRPNYGRFMELWDGDFGTLLNMAESQTYLQ